MFDCGMPGGRLERVVRTGLKGRVCRYTDMARVQTSSGTVAMRTCMSPNGSSLQAVFLLLGSHVA